MAKVKVWISEDGEVFEGTAAELCREYDIAHRRGLTRPGGAADACGVRWLSEEKFNEQGAIKKPDLYLGDKLHYIWSREKQKNVKVYHAASETACVYGLVKDALATGNLGTLTQGEAEMILHRIETQYNIIDNKPRPVPGLKEICDELKAVDREINHLNMSKAFPHIHEWNEEMQQKLTTLQATRKELEARRLPLVSDSYREERRAANAPIKAKIKKLAEERGLKHLM